MTSMAHRSTAAFVFEMVTLETSPIAARSSRKRSFSRITRLRSMKLCRLIFCVDTAGKGKHSAVCASATGTAVARTGSVVKERGTSSRSGIGRKSSAILSPFKFQNDAE